MNKYEIIDKLKAKNKNKKHKKLFEKFQQILRHSSKSMKFF